MAKDRQLGFVERLVKTAIGDDLPLGNPDDPALQKYPLLCDWMQRVYVSRKEMKSPATLTLRAGPGGWYATISDRDLQLSLDVSHPELDGLFTRIEEMLADNRTTFKNWGKKEPQLRKRKSEKT